MRFPILVVLPVLTAVAVVACVSACSRGGKTGAAPASDGGTREACVHPLKDLGDDQLKETVAGATSSAMTRMAGLEVGGRALVNCPLDGPSVKPKVVVAQCGGVRSVMWSSGSASATSYFDVGGKLSAYQESSDAPSGYTCGDGRTAQVAMYGSVPTCQPWTEQRSCSPSAATGAAP